MLALGGGVASAASDWSVFIDVESHSYTEPYEIHATAHGLSGTLGDGDFGFTHDHVAVGVGYRGWSLAAVARYDYLVEANEDTAEIAFYAENDLEVPANRRYDLTVRVNHSRSQGFKVGYAWRPESTISVGVAASFLRADSLLDGRGSGFVTTLDDNTYDGFGFVDYTYTRDPLFDRDVPSHEGRGYTVDVRLGWRPTPDWRFDLAADDLYGRITWPDASFTRADVTTSTTAFDDDGFLHVTPVLRGIESKKSYHQKLPARVTVAGSYRVTERLTVTTNAFAIRDEVIPEFGFGFYGGSQRYWSLAINSVGALTFGLRTPSIRFEFATDAFELHEAHYLKLNLLFRIGSIKAAE